MNKKSKAPGQPGVSSAVPPVLSKAMASTTTTSNIPTYSSSTSSSATSSNGSNNSGLASSRSSVLLTITPTTNNEASQLRIPSASSSMITIIPSLNVKTTNIDSQSATARSDKIHDVSSKTDSAVQLPVKRFSQQIPSNLTFDGLSSTSSEKSKSGVEAQIEEVLFTKWRDGLRARWA